MPDVRSNAEVCIRIHRRSYLDLRTKSRCWRVELIQRWRGTGTVVGDGDKSRTKSTRLHIGQGFKSPCTAPDKFDAGVGTMAARGGARKAT